MEASEHSLCNAGGWVAPGVPGALAGRPELVLPLQPFACFWLGGSGELLGGSEGGPEGARGRSRSSPRATFRGSEGSLSGLAEVCWHISGSSGHLRSWLRCREHDSSWFNIIRPGPTIRLSVRKQNLSGPLSIADRKILFRGRRQWAQPSQSADPAGPARGEARVAGLGEGC